MRVFFRRSSEHHSRNDSSSSSTSWSHDVHVFPHIRTRCFSEGSVQQHPPPYSFRRRVRIKNKPPSRTNQQYVVQYQQKQQRHPQQKQAAAAAAAAAADEKQKQQKTPKARANIYVYSSTRFFGLTFEDEKTVPSSSELRHRDNPTHAQQSYSYQVPQLRHLPQTPVPLSVERA